MNETDVVCFVAISSIVWGVRGLAVVKRYFKNVIIVDMPWPHSKADDERSRQILDTSEYDYLISWWNGLFLRKKDFQKARKGCINFHPSPPEHPGLGFWTFVRLFPELRTFHGATLHEVDDKLDHGEIYAAERFPVLPRLWMTDVELVLKTGAATLELLEKTCAILRQGVHTSELAALRGGGPPPQWGPKRFVDAEEVEWLKALPPDDPTRHLAQMGTGADGLILCNILRTPFDSLREYAASVDAPMRTEAGEAAKK
jgi:methionyl-tRNA formyltransferase